MTRLGRIARWVAESSPRTLRLVRGMMRIDPRLQAQHFQSGHHRKLHLGCGNRHLEGWLNTDLNPPSRYVFELDATRVFPFRNEEFDYVYSEHMIEHLAYDQGVGMLRECFRVLRPGGRIRIVTPNIEFLMDLYRESRSELQERYLEWTTDTFVPAAPFHHQTFTLNNFFRSWGHQFIYDETVLRDALERAGFTDILLEEVGSSREPELRGLEHEHRLPPGFLRLESMILEGAKPA